MISPVGDFSVVKITWVEILTCGVCGWSKVMSTMKGNITDKKCLVIRYVDFHVGHRFIIITPGLGKVGNRMSLPLPVGRVDSQSLELPIG